MFVGELEGLDQPQGLVKASTDGEVVDSDLPQDTLAVDDEKPAERHPLILLENPVSPGHMEALVREQWDLDGAQAAGGLVRLDVGQVGVGRVARDGQNFGAQGTQFVATLGIGEDFRGANPGKVLGVPQQDHVLAAVILKVDGGERPVDNSVELEGGGHHSRLERSSRHG